MRHVPFLIILAATGTAAAADVARAELVAGYARTEGVDSDLVIEQENLTATWFVQGARSNEGPWQEAPFLSRTSEVIGHVERDDLKIANIDADGIGWGVGGAYADPEVPVAISAAAIFQDMKDDDQAVEVESRYWAVQAGWWALPHLIVGPRYGYARVKTGFSGVVNALDRSDTYSLFGKWVTPVVDGQWINVELDVGHESVERIDHSTDDSWVGDLAVDWYPLPWLGVGPTLKVLSGENDANEGVTWGGRASVWATPQIGVRGGFTRFDIRDRANGEDQIAWYVELVGRF